MSGDLASLDIAGKGWHLVQIHVAHADWDPEMEGDPFDDWYEVILHPRCTETLTPMDGHGIAHEWHCPLQNEIDNAGAESIFDQMGPGLHLVRCWYAPLAPLARTGRSYGEFFSEVVVEFDHIELVTGTVQP